MRKVKFIIDVGFTGCTREIIHDVDDDTTDEELRQFAEDLVWDYVTVDYREI